MKKIVKTFLVTYLFTFMWLFFGPSEIFFGNPTEFEFVYGDFGGYMAAFSVLVAFGMTVFLLCLRETIYRILLAVVFGCSVASYLQVMFLNTNLELLGVNLESYQPTTQTAIVNLSVWIVCIGIAIALLFVKKGAYEKIMIYVTSFLLVVQVVALGTLFLGADASAYSHAAKNKSEVHLTGREQFTVSQKENVIVIILDHFSNQYLSTMYEHYPDATDFLNDFTFYSNADCSYFGTFPSLPYMLTGWEFDPSVSVTQWCKEAWESEQSKEFYDLLHQNGYKANIYSPDSFIMCGMNGMEIMEGKVDNLVDYPQNIDVFYKKLFKMMADLSAYRLAPDLLKFHFDVKLNELDDIVEVLDDPIYHQNADFYDTLITQGLQVDESSKYYIFQHLIGVHDYTVNELCEKNERGTLHQTTKGCMVMVEEYLKQLKKVGAYDNSTIIITADHGGWDDPQVVYYIKEKAAHHDKMQVTNAPISHHDYMATIIEAIGLDYTKFGKAVHDFKEGEQRERTVYIRAFDSNYPAVDCYTKKKKGQENVFYKFTYTGEYKDLFEEIEKGPTEIVPMFESFF